MSMDIIIAMVSTLLGAFLLPQLIDVVSSKIKINLFTGYTTAFGMWIIALCYFVDGYVISCCSAALTGGIWFVMAWWSR